MICAQSKLVGQSPFAMHPKTPHFSFNSNAVLSDSSSSLTVSLFKLAEEGQEGVPGDDDEEQVTKGDNEDDERDNDDVDEVEGEVDDESENDNVNKESESIYKRGKSRTES